MIKQLLSNSYRRLGSWYRQFVFRRALRKVIEDPISQLQNHPKRLQQLIYGWSNEAWSAEQDYLKACISHAIESPGPFLECGSGLSTVVVGVIADHQGKTLHALEHSSEWRDRVSNCLNDYSIGSVSIHLASLKKYEKFEWYDVPDELISEKFRLVICDGPPGTTAGGRFGLLPVMQSSLGDDCVILLDDAQRPAEQQIIERWCAEYGLEKDSWSNFAILKIPSSRTHTPNS